MLLTFLLTLKWIQTTRRRATQHQINVVMAVRDKLIVRLGRHADEEGHSLAG